ncbi:MAG: Ig domain-containing protein [Roseburia sp.]|nr:Ig domain-containing protein [Roseburia sp.]
MKKFLSVLMALICVICCAFSLVACGDSGNTDNNSNNNGNNNNGGNQTQTVAVTGVTLNKSTLTLDIGDSETLTATVKPDNATNRTVTWSSDKPEIASVKDGKVTAVKDGTATITATADGKSATCTVTVNKATQTPPDGTISVTGVTLNKSTLTLDIGDSETLTATVKPDNATNRTVSWSSNKSEIASVDNTGKITAKADGTATITATADGKSDTCTVTVNKAQPAANKYAEIVEALETRTGKEILMLLADNNYLTYIAKSSTEISKVKANIEIGTNTTLDNDNLVSEIATTKLRGMEEHEFENCQYTTDNNSAIVRQMITKLLGDDYIVIYGTISNSRDGMVIADLGNNASFDVYALLEKSGVIYEYSETITATKDLGDVYQTVLNREQSNSTYKTSGKTPTALGELANAYFAECNK